MNIPDLIRELSELEESTRGPHVAILYGRLTAEEEAFRAALRNAWPHLVAELERLQGIEKATNLDHITDILADYANRCLDNMEGADHDDFIRWEAHFRCCCNLAQVFSVADAFSSGLGIPSGNSQHPKKQVGDQDF